MTRHFLKTVKAICLVYIMSFAAGWLARVWLRGHISPENKAALFVMLAVVLTLIVIFCTVGISRWRKNQLSPMEKRIMVFSLVMFVVMFVVGWHSDLQ